MSHLAGNGFSTVESCVGALTLGIASDPGVVSRTYCLIIDGEAASEVDCGIGIARFALLIPPYRKMQIIINEYDTGPSLVRQFVGPETQMGQVGKDIHIHWEDFIPLS